MCEWYYIKLREGISIKHGFAFKGEYFSNVGSKILLTPGNFFESGGFKYTPGKEKYYTANFPKDYLCKKDDLIVAMTEQAAGLLGSTALVPVDNVYLHNQRIGLINIIDKKFDKIFLNYLLRTKSVREQIIGSSTGTKVKHTSPNKILDVKVKVPQIQSQTLIGKLLSDLDAKIELNNKINSELEAMAKLIYDYWFMQFDFPISAEQAASMGKPQLEGKPYKSSGGKMVWNEELKRDVPEGWELKKVKELLPVITGKKDANFADENGKYNFFTCGDKILKCNSYEFDGKAILVAGNGNFNIKLYEGKFNAYQRTYILIPINENHYTVVYMAVRNHISIFANNSRGSIIKFITKGDIENINVILPSENLDLFSTLNTLTKKIELNIEENQKLAELRDWLLPMLMNGQVKVSEL